MGCHHRPLPPHLTASPPPQQPSGMTDSTRSTSSGKSTTAKATHSVRRARCCASRVGQDAPLSWRVPPSLSRTDRHPTRASLSGHLSACRKVRAGMDVHCFRWDVCAPRLSTAQEDPVTRCRRSRCAFSRPESGDSAANTNAAERDRYCLLHPSVRPTHFHPAMTHTSDHESESERPEPQKEHYSLS